MCLKMGRSGHILVNLRGYFDTGVFLFKEFNQVVDHVYSNCLFLLFKTDLFLFSVKGASILGNGLSFDVGFHLLLESSLHVQLLMVSIECTHSVVVAYDGRSQNSWSRKERMLSCLGILVEAQRE